MNREKYIHIKGECQEKSALHDRTETYKQVA